MTLLSVLIPTVGERETRFTTLVEKLRPQVHSHNGDVEVLIFWNNFEHPIAEIRQALVNEAKGEFSSFVDDDDDLPEYYCDRIIEALQSKPDVVGWRQQLYMNGVKTKPTYHSIQYTHWYDDDSGFFRDASHLNPVKREIALQVPFTGYDGPEDVSWAQRVAPLLQTEVYIEDVMYMYHANSSDSVWRGRPLPTEHYVRPELPRYFRYHPDSKEVYP